MERRARRVVRHAIYHVRAPVAARTDLEVLPHLDHARVRRAAPEPLFERRPVHAAVRSLQGRALVRGRAPGPPEEAVRARPRRVDAPAQLELGQRLAQRVPLGLPHAVVVGPRRVEVRVDESHAQTLALRQQPRHDGARRTRAYHGTVVSARGRRGVVAAAAGAQRGYCICARDGRPRSTARERRRPHPQCWLQGRGDGQEGGGDAAYQAARSRHSCTCSDLPCRTAPSSSYVRTTVRYRRSLSGTCTVS